LITLHIDVYETAALQFAVIPNQHGCVHVLQSGLDIDLVLTWSLIRPIDVDYCGSVRFYVAPCCLGQNSPTVTFLQFQCNVT